MIPFSSIPDLLVIAAILVGAGGAALIGILLLQIPAFGAVVKKHFRLSIARFQLRRTKPIVDKNRQEKTARSLDGDVLHFERP